MTTKCFPVFLGIFILVFAFEANAGIFQFSETDQNYLQALSIAAAQEAQKDADIENKLELDEDIKPEDFGLTGVGILPTSPFYFVKDIRRGVGSLLTRDSAAKAELKLQYAAEKLLEAKEIAKKEDVDNKDKKNAIENFKNELVEVKHRVEIASDKLNEEKAKELSKKVLDATLKYGKSLGKIEKDVSSDIFESIHEAKSAASEATASTFELVSPEIAANQIVEVLGQQKGSEFKDFKNLEVLKEVGAKVPENAKEAIKIAQDNALNRLQAELEKFESAKKAIFEEFIKSAGGSEIRHLEIINDLEARPISKDLRDVILGAKEHVFSKAETRLNSLSQENKEKFVEHLGDGNLEDFRILKELQNNINSGIVSGISNVASRAEAEFVKKIESTGQNEAQKKEFLGSIERFHDVKAISVLNEIEKLIPDDKKNFFAELRSKAVQEIRNDVSRATNSSQKQHIYDSLAGDHPEDFAALHKLQESTRTSDISSFIEGIKKAQYNLMQDKIENISDKERFSRYQESFKNFKQDIPDYSRFRRVFEQRSDIFESPDKALKKIEEAEKAIAEFRGIRSSLPYDSAYKSGEFDQVLRDIESILAHAERKLENARLVLSYNDIGRAFGEAQSAENMARDGIALAAKYKSGVKETKCPFYFPPPQYFCQNGAIVHQTDQNGCPLPPRCESRESRECPVVDYGAQTICPAGTHRETFKDERGCYILGKCIADKVICQAYFEGYVFDNSTNSCKKESSGGCSDPFVYHTLNECTKAHTKINICPAMPTVTSCPLGEHKVITFSSPECGAYYGCEKDIIITTPQCSDGKDNDNDGKVDYPADDGCYGKEDHDEAYGQTTGGYCGDKICQPHESYSSCSQDCGGTTKNWVEHVWNFTDGIERSMIFNRTDSEYTTFINGVHAQCAKISRSKFVWKSGAGNDSPENWQNFGIPDCTGTIVNYVCGNNFCDPGETSASCPVDCGGVGPGPSCGSYTTSPNCEANPACDWLGSSCVPTTTTFSCNNNKICEANESYTSCPADCTGITARCTYFTEATCNADTICAWVAGFGCGSKAQCNDKIDNDNDRLIDMADGGCSDNFDNDEFASIVGPGSFCSIYVTPAICETYPACDWIGSSCAPTASGSCGDHVCSSSETAISCPIDCSTTTMLYEDSRALCSDGIDNDKDGFIDLADPSCAAFTTTGTTCSSKTDSASCIVTPGCAWAATYCYVTGGGGGTTTGLLYEDSWALCYDGIDNDKDGFIDLADPSCASFTTTAKPQCSDGKDNDGDGLIDYPLDTGCYSSTDNDEVMTTSSTGLYEDSSPLCSDGIDNDKDGFIDLADPSCAAFTTTTGTTQCSDGKDNDGDAMIDYPADTGCYGREDNDETMPTTMLYEDSWALCYDGIDNDKDGFIDLADPSCAAFTTTTTSTCTTPTTCFDSAKCTASGWYWYNGMCNYSSQTTTTTCGNNVCESGESASCPADCGSTTTTTSTCTTPTTCFDSAKCTASGWYWYNGMCNYSSQTTTTTTCVSCPSPATGCWYEGGSCSTCGTVKCSTTSTTACNNNGLCESGESSSSCPTDCHTMTHTGASVLQAFWNRLLGF